MYIVINIFLVSSREIKVSRQRSYVRFCIIFKSI